MSSDIGQFRSHSGPSTRWQDMQRNSEKKRRIGMVLNTTAVDWLMLVALIAMLTVAAAFLVGFIHLVCLPGEWEGHTGGTRTGNTTACQHSSQWRVLILSLSPSLYLSVYEYVCLHVCVCLCTGGLDRWPVEDSQASFSVAVYLLFWDWVCHWNWSSFT